MSSVRGRPISKAAKQVFKAGYRAGYDHPHDFVACRGRWLRRHVHESSVRYLPEWEAGFREGSTAGTPL